MEDLGSEMAGILILWQIMASVHLGMRNHRIEVCFIYSHLINCLML